jgi:hypothetical protein
MFGNVLNKLKKSVDETEQIDEQFYAQVMDELSEGYKDKALVGKAIAQSNGNESKFDSLYVKLRAKSLQDTYLLNEQIIENERIIQNQRFASIRKKHADGYFHHMLSQEIIAKGYSIPVFAYANTFKKGREKYRGKIDYETMKYILVGKDGKIAEIFELN